MLNKKYLIIFLLVILVGLSGCIDFITTQEKQACLALTHFSSTSILGCSTQNSCYKQVENLDILSNENLPYEISNDILMYENYVASSYYYYNQSSKLLEKINNACFNEKPKDLVENVNELMFFFSQLFEYLDKTSKQSIFLLIDYSIYLEKEEVYLIPEEKLYDDFILLNNNLNQLKEIKNKDTYVYRINEEVENLHYLAQDLGFNRTYISKQNFSDLSEYYLKVYEEEVSAHEIYIPEVFEIGSYVFKKISDIESLRKINLNLNRIESYNFYNVLNRFIGKDNSILIDFKEINNNVNNNLENVFLKIKHLEISIEDNQKYLTEDTYLEFKQNKNSFKNKEISFGRYLAYLKTIDNLVSKNKINLDLLDAEEKRLLLECDLVIADAKTYTNIFYKTKIDEYLLNDSFIEKIKICDQLKQAINEDFCLLKINNFLTTEVLETKEYELFIFEDDLMCRETVGNINYKLSSNEKILLIEKILFGLKQYIQEIETNVIKNENKKRIIEIKEIVLKIDFEENIVKIINIDSKIDRLIEQEKELDGIAKNSIVENKLFDIKHVEGEYYFNIYNPYFKTIEEVSFENRYNEITSDNPNLKITTTKITAQKLFSGDNLYKINYINKKIITFDILRLDLEESIIKVNIKNEVEGIYDFFDFIPGFKTNSSQVDINNSKITYLTEKENNIFLFGNLFERESNIEVDEIYLDKYILIEKISVKNNYLKNIDQKIYFKPINNTETIIITENKKEITPVIENGYVTFILKINQKETKHYEIQMLKEKEEINLLVETYLLKLNKYQLSRFENIKNESEILFKDIKSINLNKEYSITDIKKILDKTNYFENIDLKINNSELAEINYLKLYNNINLEELTVSEKNKLDKIDYNKYKDIVDAEEELKKLLLEIQERKNEEEETKIKIDEIQLNNLKEKITKYNLEGIELSKYKDLEEIDKIIKDKLKEHAQNIYLNINPDITGLNTRKIEELINKIYILYEDYSLRDLYNINYFASITINDAERLEKNKDFLDTVMFNNELLKFEENYNAEEYEKAINSISTQTISRIEKIKTEMNLLEKGLEEVKKDAKELITSSQKNNFDSEILEFAKVNYENEKYLNTIILLKENKVNKNKLNINQYLIGIVIVFIFGLIYAYFKIGNKKKEETKQEKKKKIIRH